MKKKQKRKLIYAITLLLISAVSFFVVFRRLYPEKTASIDKKNVIPVAIQGNGKAAEVQTGTQIFFATNGKDSVYKIKKDDKWAVIWNGIEGKSYDYVSNPVFSSDGSQLAYSAELDGQAYVVVNNTQEIIAYQKATFIVFSPDGTEIAFSAVKDNGMSVIVVSEVAPGDTPVTGTVSQEYQDIGSVETPDGDYVSIIYSPDGSQMAYIVEEDGQVYVVVDGQAGEAYDSITDISWEDGQLTYTAEDGDQTVTVVDNQEVAAPVTDDTDESSDNLSSGDTSGDDTYQTTPDAYRYNPVIKNDVSSDSESADYSTCSGESCNF